MSRFEALGHFVYEKGERIGVTPPEAAVELARKLNAYQMRVERLKAEVEQLTKAGDELAFMVNGSFDFPPNTAQPIIDAYLLLGLKKWTAAKEGKPGV